MRRDRWRNADRAWVTSWRELLICSMRIRGERLGRDMIAIDIRADADLDAEIPTACGTTEGDAFTAWSEAFVYLSGEYDGSPLVSSVRRHPPAELLEVL